MLMSAYTSGRDERYFRNAQDFIPERWNRHGPSNGMVMDPFASLPFGHGRRGCIGRRLAESQMYILLYKVRQIEINFLLLSLLRVVITTNPLFHSRPFQDLHFKLRITLK
jgi:cytochrome P450